MKNSSFVILLISCLIAFTSCEKDSIKPSGITINTEKSIAAFDELAVAGPFEVTINFSTTQRALTFDTDEKYLDRIIVKENGGKLEIRLKENTVLKNNEIIKVSITNDLITKYSGTEEAIFLVQDDIATKALDISLSGESSFTADLTTDNLNISATGEASVAITGTAAVTNMRLTGESIFRDYHFECGDLDISLSGESEAFVTVQKELNVVATGESTLHYKGAPETVNKVVTGDAKVKKEE